MPYQSITLNLKKSGKVTRQTLNGRQHVVVPCVMMKEGVWAGSQGPKFYPAAELEKSAPIWNHKPVVLGHPQKNGEGVTACSPEVLEASGLGILMNTKWHDARLKTQVWLDEEHTKRVDNSILEDLEDGKKVEVSTGLYVDDEAVQNGAGEHQGKKYDKIARNHRPDHLAVLRTSAGACSVADGAGLNANARTDVPLTENDSSFGDITKQVVNAMRKTHEKPGYYWDGYLVDVFPTSFVYRHGDKLFKQEYQTANGVVTVTGTPTEVVLVTEYRKATDKAFVGNAVGEFTTPLERLHMSGKFDPAAHVKSLVGNGFEESDRAWLEKLDPTQLQKIQPKAVQKTETPTPITGNVETKTEPVPAPVLNWRQMIPAAELAAIDRATAREKTEHAGLVKKLVDLTANTAHPLAEQFLAGKTTDELEGWAKVLESAKPAAPVGNGMFNQPGNPYAQPNYGLGFGSVQPVANSNKEEPLPLPKADYGSK